VHYRVGFRAEPKSRAGFAHLFEHMMFQGSRNVPRGVHFADIQARGGTLNANTLPDTTEYYQVVPTEALDHVLKLEADRMGFLAITQRNLDNQREVVKEEIRQQVAGRPYGGFPWTVLPAVLYRKWENAHNGYGEPVDLDAATVADCADFFRRFYTPGNAVLAVCGDIDPNVAFEAARAHFAHVPAGSPPDPPDLAEPPAPDERYGTCRDALAPRPALAIGCRLPDARVDLDGYAAYVVLSQLLTGGSGARLRRALHPLGVQVDTSAGLFGPLAVGDPDTFVIVAHHPAGLDGDVVAVVTAQAAELAAGGAAAEEVERAVACALTGLYQNLDSLAYRVRFLARGELLFDRPGIVEDLALAVSRTGPAAVAAAARTVARPAGRAVLTLTPGSPRDREPTTKEAAA